MLLKFGTRHGPNSRIDMDAPGTSYIPDLWEKNWWNTHPTSPCELWAGSYAGRALLLFFCFFKNCLGLKNWISKYVQDFESIHGFQIYHEFQKNYELEKMFKISKSIHKNFWKIVHKFGKYSLIQKLLAYWKTVYKFKKYSHSQILFVILIFFMNLQK